MRRFFSSGPFLVFLSLAAFLLFIAAAKMGFKAWQVWAEKKEVERELALLSEKREDLERKISRLENPYFKEREAKDRFNIRAPGEEVLIIVEPKPNESESQKAGPATRIIDFFKNIFR